MLAWREQLFGSGELRMLRDRKEVATEVKTVLVLDANQRSALAVTRSLGRQPNVQVITADATADSLAGRSRFSQRYLRYPCPITMPEQFVAKVSHWVREYHIDYLQPTTEITSRLLLAHRTELKPAVLPFPDLNTVMAVSDKARLTRDAKHLGVPVPETREFANLSEWDYRSETKFPLIIKPALSRILVDGRWISTTVRKINDAAELERTVHQDRYLDSQPFLVQEYIPGHGGGIFALAREGEVICRFAHERLREKPPRGGVSVLCRSAAVNEDLSRYADLLLEQYRWSGVAMVEFRIDPAGTPYLMEINTRFWGSLQLSIDSGVDFPWLLFQTFMGKQAIQQPPYRVGNQLRWYLGDVDNLFLTWKDARLSMPAKLRHLAGFLAYHRQTRQEIFRLEDPAPALFELKTYLNELRGAA